MSDVNVCRYNIHIPMIIPTVFGSGTIYRNDEKVSAPITLRIRENT